MHGVSVPLGRAEHCIGRMMIHIPFGDPLDFKCPSSTKISVQINQNTQQKNTDAIYALPNGKNLR